MKNNFLDRLAEVVSAEQILQKEPLAKYTTFKIGGACDYLVNVESAESLSKVILLCQEYGIPYYMIGRGSNLLVSDTGYRGVVIRYMNPRGIEQLDSEDPEYQRILNQYGLDQEDTVLYRCQAGASLIAFALEVSRAGYTGFEFATGIPGSLGGAVAMNAGAYGGEMKQVIVEACAVDPQGQIHRYSRDELDMGYRRCIIQENHSIVTEAVFAFKKGNPEEIMARVKELSAQRIQKQPLEYPSAGSTFKRPEGYFAGKLIMDAGLRGFRVGDAMVSEKHCGFVINVGNATAQNVVDLIRAVQEIVKEKYGVMLETEVKFLGEF